MPPNDNRSTQEPRLQPELSAQSIQASPNILSTNAYLSGATTAVTLASADQAELSNLEQDFRLDRAAPSPLNSTSVSGSPALTSVCSSDDDLPYDTHDRGQLADFLGSLILDSSSGPEQNRQNAEIFNVLSADNTKLDDEFLKKSVVIDKHPKNFKEKLKQFFVLSTAGKLIYSLNGDDDVLLGYMGLITTIISSFQEGLGKQFEKIQSGDLKVVVMMKSPLILVAITKIPHEVFPSNTFTDSIIENQLRFLHNYILAVISESVIVKNFKRGMNFDLRKLLSAQDYVTLDTLAMLLTYGFYTDEDGNYKLDSSFYLKSILGNSIQCAKITNTSRSKLNEIFSSIKRLKIPKEESDLVSVFHGTFGVHDDIKYLAADLLFGFITLDAKVVSYLRPKNHQLCNRDISLLLAATSLFSQNLSHDKSMDLWIPFCMPNFNSSGFLYCYLRRFAISNLSKPLTLILLSGSKNAFYEMKEVGESLISKVTRSKSLDSRLGKELIQNLRPNWVLDYLKITTIKHFIYKREDFGQLYMDDYIQSEERASFETLKNSFELIYLYSDLINSISHKAIDAGNDRKLTYTRWQQEDNLITGFLLTGEKYQFYCLCTGSVTSKAIIEQSLQIIHWCDKNKKRLFVRQGTVF